MELTDREWKPFKIKKIFSSFYISKSNDLNKLTTGNIPFIGRSEANNGFQEMVNSKLIEKGNCISVGMVGTFKAYYQCVDFTCSQNMMILRNDILTTNNALFLNAIMNTQLLNKFSYGNPIKISRFGDEMLMLPITKEDSESPDWKFMEDYIKEQMTSKQNLYEQFVNQYLSKLDYQEAVPLEDKQWGEFYLTELFSEIQRGKRLIKTNQVNGDIPYISSTSLNNGVDNFISNKDKVRKFKNCISIANSGSVGASFYQKFEFVASDHVTHLKSDRMNQYIYLFIVTMLNRLSDKYNFNREINDKRISREKILLPVNELNQPDYEYMEQYIKNLLILKYQQYNLKII